MGSDPTAARPVRCPACGHPPTPPRPVAAWRRRLGVRPATPGCSYTQTDFGLTTFACPCRQPFHAG